MRKAVSHAKAGYDVVLVVSDGKPEEVYEGVRIISFTDRNLTRKECYNFLLHNQKLVNYLLSFEADLYEFTAIEMLEVGRKLKRAGKHIVFDHQENWLDSIPLRLKEIPLGSFIARKIQHIYYKKVLGSFDMISSVSPNMVKRLSQYNNNCYWTVNYPAISDIVDDSKVDKKDNTFVYQGTIYSFSNQDLIIDCINSIDSQVQYKIVGTISDEMIKHIHNLDKNGRVITTGRVNKETLNHMMKESVCGIIVFDYVTECCGNEGQLGSNKIFEYMMCGLPVICTDFKLWKEMIIDKYNCGICVEPGNRRQLLEAISWIVNNPEEAHEMGQRGRQAILEEFNWDHYLPDFLSKYRAILGK